MRNSLIFFTLCSYTYWKHFVQIWLESQSRKQSNMHFYYGGGGCVYGAHRNFRNGIHLTKLLRYNKMNFAVVCHKLHYHLNL